MESLSEDIEIRHMSGLGDFHLRSAITPLEIEQLTSGAGKTFEVRAYNYLKSALGTLHPMEPAQLLGRLFTVWIPNTNQEASSTYEDMLCEILSAEGRVEENELRSGSPLISISNEIKSEGLGDNNHRVWMQFLNLLLVTSNSLTSNRGMHPTAVAIGKVNGPCVTFLAPNGSQFTLGGDLFSVIISDKAFLFKLDVLRLASDKVTERYNVLLSTRQGNKFTPEIYISRDKMEEFWLKTDKYLIKYGNRSYKIFKAHEAICWGLLQGLEHSNIVDNKKFLNAMIASLKEDFEEETVEDYVRTISKTCSTPHHYAQLAGVFRSWGHPEVSMLEGINQVKKIATSPKIENHIYPKVAGWKAKEMLYLKYFNEMFNYPPHILKEDSLQDDYTITRLRENEPINIKDPAYSLSSWEAVDTLETFPPPETFNLSLIVADTAISPTRDEILNSKKKGDILDPYKRRGVLKFIKDGVVNCRDLLTSINQNPEGLEKRFRMIGLYPKEREVNPKARMFSLMTLILRAYIVVTEEMLSGILKYFPGITMTEDLLSLNKKILSYTQDQKRRNPGSATFVINVDFEKWNLNMRSWATFHVFEFLGRLFGLETLFNKTYTIFSLCIIYLADGSFLPELDELLNLVGESPWAYTGHQGGLEGLRQKGWTIFTVVIISYICDKRGIKYKLMGQGDNQVLIVTIYSEIEQRQGFSSKESEQEIKDQLDEFMKEFYDVFSSLGLPIKESETWISESLFLYGKIPVYKNMTLANSFKRLSRIFPFSNEDLMTLDNAMAAIGANAITASACDVTPYISLFIARWQQILCLAMFLRYHPLGGGQLLDPLKKPRWKIKENERTYDYTVESPCNFRYLIKSLIFSFKSLGGTNSIHLNQLIMRGFPDSASRDLEFLSKLRDSNLNVDSDVARIADTWYKVKLSHSKERTMLIEDPTALNLLVPPQTLSITRKLIRESLKNAPVTSEFGAWFRELLTIPSDESRSKLISALLAGETVFPRLSHEMYSASLYGYSESIISKVDKTVTLSRISMKGSKVDVVGILVRGEARFMNYLWWRSSILSPSDVTPHPVPSVYAQRIRDEGWGCIIDGVTVPFPSQLFSVCLCNPTFKHTPLTSSDFISSSVSNSITNDSDIILKYAGRGAPYLGSSTKEKLFSKHEKAIYGTEPLLRRPVSLFRLIGWVVEKNSNYSKLIEDLVKSITNADIMMFRTAEERPSGSAAHRFRDSATEHGAMYNNLLSPGSFLSISSEGMHKYSRGSQNVNLHYQAVFCYVQSVTIRLILGGLMTNTPIRVLHFHLNENHGLVNILENIPDLPEAISRELIPSSPTNPYLYIPADLIKMKRARYMTSRLQANQIPSSSFYKNFSQSFIEQVAEDNLSFSIVSKIVGARTEADDSEEMFDLQGLNRFFLSKIQILNILRRIYWRLMARVYIREIQENTSSFPTLKSIKKQVMKILHITPSPKFVDLTPIFWDQFTVKLLRECDLYSVPLAYPFSPIALSHAAKSLVINYCKSNEEKSPIRTPGVLLDEFSSKPIDFINYAIWSRLYDMRMCVYCKISLWSHPKCTAEDIIKFPEVRCERGHPSGYQYQRHISWGIVTLSFSSLIKSLPNIDIFPIGADTMLQGPEISLPFEYLWSSKEKNSWLKNQPAYPDLALLSEGAPLGSYDLFGCIKVPTKGFVRTYEICSIARRLGFSSFLSDRKTAMVLGDGFGYSAIAVKASGIGRVVSWTYILVDESAPHSLDLAIPPAQLIMRVEQSIINYPSVTLESDITSSGWINAYKLINRSTPIDVLISEIEMVYTDDSDLSISKYIESLIQTNCREVILKTKYMSWLALLNALNRLSSNYHSVNLVRGSLGDSGCADCWIFCKDCRDSDLKIFLSEQLANKLGNKLAEFVRYGISSIKLTRLDIYHLDDLMINQDLKIFHEEFINSWFSSGYITSWDSNLLTETWYELITHRRPKGITDESGKPDHYLFVSQAQKIGSRLMALAAARGTDDVLIDIMRSLTDWSIIWEKTRHMVGNRLFNWTVSLTKDDRKKKGEHRISRWGIPINVSETELLKVVPYLRRYRSWTRFSQLGRSIRFQYLRSMHASLARDEDYLWDNPIEGEEWVSTELPDQIVEDIDAEKRGRIIDSNLTFLISKKANYSATI